MAVDGADGGHPLDYPDIPGLGGGGARGSGPAATPEGWDLLEPAAENKAKLQAEGDTAVGELGT